MTRSSMRTVTAVLVFFLFGVISSAAQIEKKPTFKDLLAIRTPSDVQVSPDGRLVAFVVAESSDLDKPGVAPERHIWVVPANGAEPARTYASAGRDDFFPRWSPDGQYLAFLSGRGQSGSGDGESQIYLLRKDGGDATRLTVATTGVQAFQWSPDSSMIAFVSRDAATNEEQERQSKGHDETEVDHGYKYARLWVFDLAGHAAVQVTKQDFNINDFCWSPDGRQFALIVAATPEIDDLLFRSKLIIADGKTGNVLRTLSEKISTEVSFHVRWSPDGQTISYRYPSPGRIGTWVALVSPASGQTRYILQDYAGDILDAAWALDSRHLVAAGREGAKDWILNVDTALRTIDHVVQFESGPDADFSFSRDGRTMVYAAEATNDPGNLWVFTTGQPARKLTDLNPQLASLQFGIEKEVSWKNKKDGQTIHGVLVVPPDLKPGQRYPTVIDVHGGPPAHWWVGWYGGPYALAWAQLLATRGYVVLLPNPRGSSGNGWRFTDVADWGGMDFQDIMDGLDSLVAQGVADPNRLGVGGWSFGGFMTAWAVTHTQKFKAAVAGAAPTDLVSWYGTTVFPGVLDVYFPGSPSIRREVHAAHSPVAFLKDCKTPTLLLYGAADNLVPLGQGEEFYRGLKQFGVETELVVYPREGHMPGELAHQVNVFERVLAWYDHYLK